MIVVYGANGSMGRRYMAILRHLDVQAFPVEVDTNSDTIPHDRATGYIVATPTHTHMQIVRHLVSREKPILCEKPISKDLDEVREFCRLIQFHPLTMVAQYAHLIRQGDKGLSHYDYFRTGQDGLAWDCIQIAGFALTRPILGNTSPVWTCSINGRPLSIASMDQAYVDMVTAWIEGERGVSPNWILQAHERAASYQKEFDSARH